MTKTFQAVIWDFGGVFTTSPFDAFTRYEAETVAPLSVEISAGRLFNMVPPTQGVSSLMILALFDRLGVTRGESFDHVHGLIEATKQAFILRNAELGDPDFMARPAADWLLEEAIAELHRRYAGLDAGALRAVEVADQDYLTRWAIDYLGRTPDARLPDMLDAALQRKYSASPYERFFTGGGLHTFANFRKEDNGRIPTLIEALRESINLPFIRLMRDLVRYSTYQAPGNSAELLKDDKDPRRQTYLSRFADREGKTFLLRFWRKYQDQPAQQRLETFLSGLRHTPVRLAAVHRYLMPEADMDSFGAFLRSHLPDDKLTDKRITELYLNYGPGAYSLPDQGYIARVHPLELWLLGYLLERPQASFNDAVLASHDQRQEVYGWLFRSRHKSARDSRIRIMLEVEAFSEGSQSENNRAFSDTNSVFMLLNQFMFIVL